MALYESTRTGASEAMRSQFTLPLLNAIFRQPVFTASQLLLEGNAPSLPVLYGLIQNLVDAGILKLIEKKGGRKPARYAFAELLNLCEGRKVF